MIVVIDTNILVAAAYAPHSASRRIVEACLEGLCQLALSPQLEREYELIVKRAVRGRRYQERLRELMAKAVRVTADPAAHPVPDDMDDAKVLATAVSARATAIISNDHHLLCLHPYQGIAILRPSRFVAELLGAES